MGGGGCGGGSGQVNGSSLEAQPPGDNQTPPGRVVPPLSARQQALLARQAAAVNLGAAFAGTIPSTCQSAIDAIGGATGGRVPAQSMVDTAKKLTFYDGTDSEGLAGRTDWNELFRNSPNFVSGTMSGYTVADAFARDGRGRRTAAAMLGLNQVGLGVVFVRPSNVNTYSAARTAALVMHEVIHFMGFEDGVIQQALNETGFSPNRRGSIEITDAFSRECFGTLK